MFLYVANAAEAHICAGALPSPIKSGRTRTLISGEDVAATFMPTGGGTPPPRRQSSHSYNGAKRSRRAGSIDMVIWAPQALK